ncbi:MAG: hypothetical protein ACK2U9_23190, partial [Anaerolineae bacterium]
MTTTTKTVPRRAARFERPWWVTPLLGLLVLVAGWWLLNLIIGGKCGADCVVGPLAQTLRLATPIAFAAFCGVMCER